MWIRPEHLSNKEGKKDKDEEGDLNVLAESSLPQPQPTLASSSVAFGSCVRRSLTPLRTPTPAPVLSPAPLPHTSSSSPASSVLLLSASQPQPPPAPSTIPSHPAPVSHLTNRSRSSDCGNKVQLFNGNQSQSRSFI